MLMGLVLSLAQGNTNQTRVSLCKHEAQEEKAFVLRR